MFGRNIFDGFNPSGHNHNSDPSGSSQSQSNNSNTNINIFLHQTKKPFGYNHNSGPSGPIQSQSDNSNTNANTLLPMTDNPFVPLTDNPFVPLTENPFVPQTENPFVPLTENPFVPQTENPFVPLTENHFGYNHNSGPSGSIQSQFDNSNTNTNTENAFDHKPSKTARFPSVPSTGTQNKPALFGGPPSFQPLAQQGGGPLFAQAAFSTPTSTFGHLGATMEQHDIDNNISPFAGATPTPNMTCRETPNPVPNDEGDLVEPAHQQSSIDSGAIHQMREDMRVFNERLRRLEGHQRSGFGGR